MPLTAPAVSLHPITDFSRDALAIDAMCYPMKPWTVGDLLHELSENRRAKPEGVVISAGARIVGYIVLHDYREWTEVRRLGVLPLYRRGGIGRALLEVAEARIASGRCRYGVEIPVPERDLGSMRFLAACGYESKWIAPGWFGAGNDGWVFKGPKWHTAIQRVRQERRVTA